MRRALPPVPACLCAFAVAAVLPAQDLPAPPARMPYAVHRHWDATSGLPQNTPIALLCAGDGHLWIGTLGGLCRFDGSNMRVFDLANTPELHSCRIRSLHESPDGALWIATDRSGVTRLDGDRFTHLEGLPQTSHACIGHDRSGRVHVGTEDGMFRFDQQHFSLLPSSQGIGFDSLLLRRDGTLVASSGHGLCLVHDNGVEILDPRPVGAIAETIDGTLWAATDDGLARWDDGRLQPWSPLPELRGRIRTLFGAHDGSLWVGCLGFPLRLTSAQLAAPPGQLTAEAVTVPFRTAGEPQGVSAMAEDPEGGIWVGMNRSGLYEIRMVEMDGYDSADGLVDSGVQSVLGDRDQTLWVGTTQGLFRRRQGAFERLPPPAGVEPVRALLREGDGSILAAVTTGILRVAADRQDWLLRIDPKQARTVLSMHRDRAGRLWIGSDRGLQQCQDGALQTPTAVTALASTPIRTLTEADDGALWIGGLDLAARLPADGQPLRVWRAGSQLPYGEVRVVLPASRGPKAWIGSYGGGFTRIDDARCTTVDEVHGLLDQTITAALPFEQQWVVASNLGVFSVRIDDLEAVADGRLRQLVCHPFRVAPGCSPECTGGMQPSGTAADGRFWFCGIDALFAVTPATHLGLRKPLPCHVETVVAGQDRWVGESRIELDLGVRSIAFRLTACAYAHPAQTRFRWRLLGHDSTWTAPMFQSEARFALLAPGDYVFEAEAIDIDGLSSLQPVRVPVHVPAYVWEGATFWLVLGGAAVGLAFLLLRLGARHAAARARLLQRRVDERTSELRATQAGLEERVASRTEELRQALQRQQTELAERRRLEGQLQQLQRMESVGQLAGGIAHDFNNLLTVVLGSSTLIEREFPGTLAAELAVGIRDAGERGRRLTQHLLAVASRQVVTPEVLDLNGVVQDLSSVLRPLLGEAVQLSVVPAAEPARVLAAVTQVEQILLNLAGNARDAMPRGGRLEIAVSVEAAAVHLVVSDTGTGMPPEVCERVFEPFFTTKPVGRGAGLGLTTVYGITKQLGGEVKVSSEMGKGTTFRLRLPRIGKEPRSAADGDGTVPKDVTPYTPGNLLLIEDEDAVRTVLQRMLERLGCRVTAAANGEAGVALLARDPGAVDAVLSDVVMPGLQGIALVRALRAVRADLPIVFLSGYLEGKGTYQDLVDAGLRILTKPPQAAEVAEAIRAAIRGRPTG